MPAGVAGRPFSPIDDALCFPGAGIDSDADSDTDPEGRGANAVQTAAGM